MQPGDLKANSPPAVKDPDVSVEVEALERASAKGHLDEVHDFFSQYMLAQRPDPATGYIDTSWIYGALALAVDNDHVPVVSYLLDRGLQVMACHLEGAVRARSTDTLQVLLDHGWNINEPTAEQQPPALR